MTLRKLIRSWPMMALALQVILQTQLAGSSLLAQSTAVGARSSVAGGSTKTLKVGDPAPDFELPDQNAKTVHLSEFKGKKNVVLAFYVLAFTGG